MNGTHDHPPVIRLLRRLRIAPVWTPAEASWLNMEETVQRSQDCLSPGRQTAAPQVGRSGRLAFLVEQFYCNEVPTFGFIDDAERNSESVRPSTPRDAACAKSRSRSL